MRRKHIFVKKTIQCFKNIFQMVKKNEEASENKVLWNLYNYKIKQLLI